MHDPRISALLRLKRFEQPPEGYFDELLAEVHRRQRTELLRRPLWQIAVERVQVFFGEHSMGGLSYGGAMAALAVGGVVAIGYLTPSLSDPAPHASIAAQEAPAAAARPGTAGTNRMIVLGPQNRGETALGNPAREADALAITAPRYVIDARPVSYEPASRF